MCGETQSPQCAMPHCKTKSETSQNQSKQSIVYSLKRVTNTLYPQRHMRIKMTRLQAQHWLFLAPLPHRKYRLHVVINMHTDNPAPLRINAPITTRRHRSSTWRPEVIRLHVVDGKVKRQHVSVWPRWEQSDWLNAHLTWDGREIKRPQQGQQTD